jgi:lipopolysaccharide/colanic/teichoic acid biosynthesis glycosyltransferase
MSTTRMEAGLIPAEHEIARPAAAESRSTVILCRILDVLVAAILLVALAPVFAAIALAIRLDSRGHVIFRQLRVGRGGRPFMVNKFRTMRPNADHARHREFVIGLIHDQGRDENSEEPFFKMTSDTRITRVGTFLRRSSLDELPQLWNVLIGNMSLVGPRPPIPYEVEHYPSHWFGRFAVKPGMTGLWQVSGRSRLTLEEMIRLDIEYARNRSAWLNLKILVRTIPAVLFARGAA